MSHNLARVYNLKKNPSYRSANGAMQLWLNWVPGLQQCWGASYSVKTLTQQKDPKELVHSGNCICDTCIIFLSLYIHLIHLIDHRVMHLNWLTPIHILLSLQKRGGIIHPLDAVCSLLCFAFFLIFHHTQNYLMHLALNSIKAGFG